MKHICPPFNLRLGTLSLGAALAGVLIVGGCDFLGGDSKVEDNSAVLAVVNGVNLTQKDLDSAISQLPPNVRAMPLDQLREPLMDTLIETELLAAEAQAIWRPWRRKRSRPNCRHGKLRILAD